MDNSRNEGNCISNDMLERNFSDSSNSSTDMLLGSIDTENLSAPNRVEEKTEWTILTSLGTCKDDSTVSKRSQSQETLLEKLPSCSDTALLSEIMGISGIDYNETFSNGEINKDLTESDIEILQDSRNEKEMIFPALIPSIKRSESINTNTNIINEMNLKDEKNKKIPNSNSCVELPWDHVGSSLEFSTARLELSNIAGNFANDTIDGTEERNNDFASMPLVSFSIFIVLMSCFGVLMAYFNVLGFVVKLLENLFLRQERSYCTKDDPLSNNTCVRLQYLRGKFEEAQSLEKSMDLLIQLDANLKNNKTFLRKYAKIVKGNKNSVHEIKKEIEGLVVPEIEMNLQQNLQMLDQLLDVETKNSSKTSTSFVQFRTIVEKRMKLQEFNKSIENYINDIQDFLLRGFAAKIEIPNLDLEESNTTTSLFLIQEYKLGQSNENSAMIAENAAKDSTQKHESLDIFDEEMIPLFGLSA